MTKLVNNGFSSPAKWAHARIFSYFSTVTGCVYFEIYADNVFTSVNEIILANTYKVSLFPSALRATVHL